MSSSDHASVNYDGSRKPPPSKPLSKMSMILQLLPKIPLVARVALLHILQVSPQSKYMDLTTDVTVAVLRSFLAPSKQLSVTQTQKLINRDPGVKGRIWVGQYTAPSPGRAVRDAIIRAITGLHEGDPLDDDLLKRLSEAGPVEAEWTGYRPGATEVSTLPPVSERERYSAMMKDVKSPTTILYFHGGAYYLMDPCTHRSTTKTLAKLTGGRCYSVRYRLAPQHPFPAAVIDALTSYLTLLHPPPDAFHEPVSPSHIVFAGDSAGGNLSLALLQTILELNRQALASPSDHTTIPFHGVDIPLPLPLPAGVAVSSPWLDMTHSSPSCESNAPFDYLPSLDPTEGGAPSPPPCSAWPASPPRERLYVADELATHPLVTLLAARSWRGSPPVWMCTGWELLADEDKLLAKKMHHDGVRVVFEEYEAMPHCFAQIFTKLGGSRRCMAGWSDFIKEVTTDFYNGAGNGGKGESRFVTIRARTLEEVPIEVGQLAPYGEREMRERIVSKGRVRVGGLDDTAAKL